MRFIPAFVGRLLTFALSAICCASLQAQTLTSVSASPNAVTGGTHSELDRKPLGDYGLAYDCFAEH